MTGKDTSFSRLKSGDTLTLETGQEVLVEEVIDEGQLRVRETEELRQVEKPSRFKVTPKLDYS